MDIKPDFTRLNAEASFKKIMDFKGEIAPIAEKACRNFEVKTKNSTNYGHLYYFAIGHALNSMLNKKQVFNLRIKDGGFQKFKTLKESAFTAAFCQRLEIVKTEENKRVYAGLLPDIRNLNNHYAHCFNGIKLDEERDKPIIDFLMDCFQVALIQVYLDENNIRYEDFEKDENHNGKLTEFISDKFKNKNNAEYISSIKSMKPYEAIKTILFADVETEFTFHLTKTIPVQITPGKYLSFYGCLFLLMLFMYRDEAELLISRISGFKRNNETYEQSKRNLFTYFCKKTSSRDSDTETPDLVNFREIMLYLNKYPTQWNKEYEIENDKAEPFLLKRLKDKLIEMEIDKLFFRDAEYRNADKNAIEETRLKFQIYAKFDIWELDKNKRIKTNYSDKEIERFHKLIHDHSLQRDAEEKLGIIEKLKTDKSYDTEIERLNGIIDECVTQNKTSEELKRIQDRLTNNLYYTSQGRNQDAFMDYAMRFLAETSYFGKDAKFKMYEFYSPKHDKFKKLCRKRNWPKEKYDKIKLHNGKMVDFFSWDGYMAKHQNWYFPFVIQNNAAQVAMTLDGTEKIVTLQRDLIVYLLQHAFDNLNSDNTNKSVEGKGFALLEAYYRYHQAEFNQKLPAIQYITNEQKADYKKLFPKRLLQQASPDVFEANRNVNYLHDILQKAEAAEQRYNERYKRAVDKIQFERNNKGKQFKLSFIRSAWNLMYFKPIYDKRVELENAHHKRFHITRDEFNDFSRLMFGLDTNPVYCKDELGKLFESKRFFDNKEFESLFKSAESFARLYDKTKEKYKTWKDGQTLIPKGTFTLESYIKQDKPKEEPMLGGKMFYINTSHFAGFLKDRCNWPKSETGVPRFMLMEQNAPYLIEELYANTPQNKSRNSRKAYYETKREDCLLYEIALYYLKQEFLKHDETREQDLTQILGQKATVNKVLARDFMYRIKDKYTINVPLNNLDSFLESVARKEEDELLYNNSSFMANIYTYLNIIWNEIPENERNGTVKNTTHKDLFPICFRFFNKNEKKTLLTYNEYLLINKSLLRSSNLLTQVAIKLEKHSLYNEKNTLLKTSEKTGCAFIEPEDAIDNMDKYFGKGHGSMRNKAAHFGVPTLNSYQKQLDVIATEFANRYLKNKGIGSFVAIGKNERDICRFLAETIFKDKIGFTDNKKNNDEAHKCFYKKYIR